MTTDEQDAFRGDALSASLTVNDLEKSLAWYTDVFGFTVTRRYEREGRTMAVSLQAGNVRILLTRDDGAQGSGRVKGAGFSLQITTDQDVDQIVRRIGEAGGVLESQPADTPWGQRMFRLRDPDGFRFTVSSIP